MKVNKNYTRSNQPAPKAYYVPAAPEPIKVECSVEEINTLIEEYNAAELIQKERLIKLFVWMRNRKGAREVHFGLAKWCTNDFNGERLDLALQVHVNNLFAVITGINVGSE